MKKLISIIAIVTLSIGVFATPIEISAQENNVVPNQTELPSVQNENVRLDGISIELRETVEPHVVVNNYRFELKNVGDLRTKITNEQFTKVWESFRQI